MLSFEKTGLFKHGLLEKAWENPTKIVAPRAYNTFSFMIKEVSSAVIKVYTNFSKKFWDLENVVLKQFAGKASGCNIKCLSPRA